MHHAPRITHHGKPKTISLCFSSKRRGTKINMASALATSVSRSFHVQFTKFKEAERRHRYKGNRKRLKEEPGNIKASCPEKKKTIREKYVF